MRGIKIVGFMLALTFLVIGHVCAEGLAGKTKPQTNCPVMGGKINKAIYTDHAGKRVYFCCKACIAEFRKDPEKYVKTLEEEGFVLEDVPGIAPGIKQKTKNKRGNGRSGSCRGCDGCS